MALTFKKFVIGAVELPATIFSGIVDLTFGYTETDENGKAKLDKNKKPIEHDGLLGLILNGIKAVGRGVSAFIADHKKAIAIAFWASLFVAGGLALTLFLWPAALTAVAGFSVYGLSIAGIVGANSLLQIGLAAGLAAAATSIATYFTAAIANTIIAIKNACCSSPSNPSNPSDSDSKKDDGIPNASSSQKIIHSLHKSTSTEDLTPSGHVIPIDSKINNTPKETVHEEHEEDEVNEPATSCTM